MPFEAVLDASGAVAFAVPDEAHYAAAGECVAALRAQGAAFIAPPLFESEFDSVLRRRVFLGTLTSQAAVAALRVVDALQIEMVYDA